MYYCKNCRCEFEEPKIIIETHGLSSPPYESFCVCPFCRSTDFSEIRIKYCHACGARLYGDNNTNYCNDSCRITDIRLRKKEATHRKKINESPLATLIREVDKYNAEHNTKVSYGQYVALIKPKLLEEENAKKETIS